MLLQHVRSGEERGGIAGCGAGFGACRNRCIEVRVPLKHSSSKSGRVLVST